MGDMVQVAFQTIELVFTVSANSKKGFAFFSVLRFCRILRFLRIIRLVNYLADIAVVTNAIMSSFRSVFAASVLLFALNYVVGITILSVVTAHRINLMETEGKDNAELAFWWASLRRGMQTICASLFGGIDWDAVVNQLNSIHEFWGGLFVSYVAFAMLCVMNVITGIFVQSALQSAERAKTRAFECALTSSFNNQSDDSDPHQVTTRADFEASISDEFLRRHMRDLGIETAEARALFMYLESDRSTVNTETLKAGLLRLRRNARFIDIVMVMAGQSKLQVSRVPTDGCFTGSTDSSDFLG